MKVLVPIKRVVDPAVKIRVLANETGVDLAHTKMGINPFDEIALEEAIRWKEAGLITEITVLSIGSEKVQENLRGALALGADKAILIQTDQILEPINIAHCLKAIVQKEKFDIVILGKQAIDDDCNQTAQMLAALLNWPQGTFASKITFSADKKNITVIREVDDGLETLQIQLPAVISADLRLNEPRYATLPNIMQAKRKPIDILKLESLGLTLLPHVKVLSVKPAPMRKKGILVKDVAELMNYLKNVEKVL